MIVGTPSELDSLLQEKMETTSKQSRGWTPPICDTARKLRGNVT